MIWARWAGVMGVPMKWAIARIFVVGTGGSGLCAEAAPSGVIGFFMAVAPYSSFGILLLIVSVFDAWSKNTRQMPEQLALPMPHRPLQRIHRKSTCTQPPNSAFSWVPPLSALASNGREDSFASGKYQACRRLQARSR